MDVTKLNEQYVTEGYDENGVLNKFEVNLPDNFNYAYDVIDEIAKAEPNRTAIVWTNDNGGEKVITYGEFMRKSNQVANMLLDIGVQKGDKVMSVLKRHYQVWFLIMGLSKIGAVIIPATNQLLKKDYVYRFTAAEVKYVVATADGMVTEQIEEALDEALEGYGGIKQKFIVNGERDGWLSFDTELEKYPETLTRIESKVTDDMLMYFTSGTTGYPKMVMHTQRYGPSHLITGKHWHNLKGDSLHMTISESGWAKFTWGKMYGQFMTGAAIFVFDFDRFNPNAILEKVAKYKITSLCAPPTMFRMMLLAEDIDKYDLSCVKYCTIAGEALSPEVFNSWYNYTGIKLMEGFGQTETVVVCANLPGMEPKPGSMGKPVPLYNVDIVDNNGNSMPEGETGEIVIRTQSRDMYGLFRGYYKNEEATQNAWHDNMYFTGDTAYKDEEGYFWYVGRKDDLIKSSGYRIGPFEIESVLLEHDAVLEAAVTGVKDEVRGQVVKATIVLKNEYKSKADNETEKAALIKDIQEHVKNTTAPYKYPRIIEFVPELPKTVSGKIRRIAIREQDNE